MMFSQTQFAFPYISTGMNDVKQGSSKENLQRSRFTKYEDEILKKLVESQPKPNWKEIAQQLNNRTPRQCRERYNNYLRPNLLNGSWTQEEEELLIKLYEKYGPKWSLISQSFNSRSSVNIKNHYSSLMYPKINKIHRNEEQKNVNEIFYIHINPKVEKKEEVYEAPIIVNEKKEEVYEAPIFVNENKEEEYEITENQFNEFDNLCSNFEMNFDDIWSNGIENNMEDDLFAF